MTSASSANSSASDAHAWQALLDQADQRASAMSHHQTPANLLEGVVWAVTDPPEKARLEHPRQEPGCHDHWQGYADSFSFTWCPRCQLDLLHVKENLLFTKQGCKDEPGLGRDGATAYPWYFSELHMKWRSKAHHRMLATLGKTGVTAGHSHLGSIEFQESHMHGGLALCRVTTAHLIPTFMQGSFMWLNSQSMACGVQGGGC